MILLIDGDSILYRVSFRGEELGDEVDISDVEEDDGLEGLEELDDEYAYSNSYNEDGSLKQIHKLHLPTSYDAVHYAIKSILDSVSLDMITSDEKIDSIEIHMTGKPGREFCDDLRPNFRSDYVDDYKAQRKDSRPPAGLPELWSYIFSINEVDKVPCNVYVADGCEADDTVVHLKTINPDNYFVAALDKDVLFQTVGRHYNYGKQEFVEVEDSVDALRYLYFQMIAGDPSDGYKGVPGVGKVGANKALAELTTEKEMFDVTLELYKKKGLGLGECIQTGILASMHQVTSVTYEGNRIIPEISIYRRVK